MTMQNPEKFREDILLLKQLDPTLLEQEIDESFPTANEDELVICQNLIPDLFCALLEKHYQMTADALRRGLYSKFRNPIVVRPTPHPLVHLHTPAVGSAEMDTEPTAPVAVSSAAPVAPTWPVARAASPPREFVAAVQAVVVASFTTDVVMEEAESEPAAPADLAPEAIAFTTPTERSVTPPQEAPMQAEEVSTTLGVTNTDVTMADAEPEFAAPAEAAAPLEPEEVAAEPLAPVERLSSPPRPADVAPEAAIEDNVVPSRGDVIMSEAAPEEEREPGTQAVEVQEPVAVAEEVPVIDAVAAAVAEIVDFAPAPAEAQTAANDELSTVQEETPLAIEEPVEELVDAPGVAAADEVPAPIELEETAEATVVTVERPASPPAEEQRLAAPAEAAGEPSMSEPEPEAVAVPAMREDTAPVEVAPPADEAEAEEDIAPMQLDEQPVSSIEPDTLVQEEEAPQVEEATAAVLEEAAAPVEETTPVDTIMSGAKEAPIDLDEEPVAPIIERPVTPPRRFAVPALPLASEEPLEAMSPRHEPVPQLDDSSPVAALPISHEPSAPSSPRDATVPATAQTNSSKKAKVDPRGDLFQKEAERALKEYEEFEEYVEQDQLNNAAIEELTGIKYRTMEGYKDSVRAGYRLGLSNPSCWKVYEAIQQHALPELRIRHGVIVGTKRKLRAAVAATEGEPAAKRPAL